MTDFRLLDDETERAEAVDTAAVTAMTPLEHREIFNEGRYRAVVENLDFMWRWKIFRDGEMCQEGCSLSEASSCEAVRHVLAFYEVRDSREAAA
jgi:soluble methane monooxygenase-binding protein MmoD